MAQTRFLVAALTLVRLGCAVAQVDDGSCIASGRGGCSSTSGPEESVLLQALSQARKSVSAKAHDFNLVQAASETCAVWALVQCPGGNGSKCTTGQCCPGAHAGEQNFPCPSAPADWCKCQSCKKKEDCLAPSPTPAPAPSPKPTPAPGQGSRLVVKNACDTDPIWIASMIPDEYRDQYPNNLKLMPGEQHEFQFPANETVSSTRFWPKMGCNETGMNCTMGSSGGAGQACPTQGCAPPVDSKFEATWGDLATAEPVDWWDTSGVDGYTLPYKVDLDSNCPVGKNLDCSDLSLHDCPMHEILVSEGADDRNVSLKMFDQYDSNALVGCYSPCGKLTYSNWGNSPTWGPTEDAAKMYCCPTPPISSKECNHGPVMKTQYINLFRQKCKDVYSFAYDDAAGLQTCPVGTTYTWTLFCPA